MNHKTEFIHIKSLAGEPCIITTDIVNPVFKGGRNFTVQSLENNTYRIDLKKGEEVFISPKGEEPEFIISPITHTSQNYFGLKIIR
ncbi:hypothetical protein AB9N12_19380 [Bacteroides sp. AN502(2024)]|uniref:hypothetical protein n=1 Tax=Bacteroides sp. AN502(2024) TaxID=3160599 RepID=UPI0035190F9B